MITFSIDPGANAAYVLLDAQGDHEVVETITILSQVSLDLDADGKVLGIEILNVDAGGNEEGKPSAPGFDPFTAQVLHGASRTPKGE